MKKVLFTLFTFTLLSVACSSQISTQVSNTMNVQGVVERVEFINSAVLIGTIVYFQDGRVIVFEGTSSSFQIGKMHHVFYGDCPWGDDYIIESVRILN